MLIVNPRIAPANDRSIVLGDGQEIHYKEIRMTPTNQTLSISFMFGINEIEIVGTQVT